MCIFHIQSTSDLKPQYRLHTSLKPFLGFKCNYQMFKLFIRMFVKTEATIFVIIDFIITHFFGFVSFIAFFRGFCFAAM